MPYGLWLVVALLLPNFAGAAVIDVSRVTAEIFSSDSAEACAAEDTNVDRRITAADLPGFVRTQDVPDWRSLSPVGAGARQEVGVALRDREIFVIAGFGATDWSDVFTLRR